MKAYTDLNQSKKLAEILSLESADMYYKYVLPKSERIVHTPEIGNPIDSLKWYNAGYTFRGKKEPITLSEYCIPCWSLAALLDVVPEGIIENYHAPNLQKENGKYSIAYGNEELLCMADNPIDACYEMIIKLHEQKTFMIMDYEKKYEETFKDK